MTELRVLSARQVVVCESSESRRCRCRCNGALHGAQRSELSEFFEQLPETDPHWLKEKSRQLPLPAPIGGKA
jgi:hypothetical protein